MKIRKENISARVSCALKKIVVDSVDGSDPVYGLYFRRADDLRRKHTRRLTGTGRRQFRRITLDRRSVHDGPDRDRSACFAYIQRKRAGRRRDA